MGRNTQSLGLFYVNEETNTVMGAAITDAAAWYDKADWIGITATPLATIHIQSLLEPDDKSLNHVLLRYSVPMKQFPPMELMAINWPKAFYVAGLSPCLNGQDPRTTFLELLARHQVPLHTESKYFNAIAFFEFFLNSRPRNNVRMKPK